MVDGLQRAVPQSINTIQKGVQIYFYKIIEYNFETRVKVTKKDGKYEYLAHIIINQEKYIYSYPIHAPHWEIPPGFLDEGAAKGGLKKWVEKSKIRMVYLYL